MMTFKSIQNCFPVSIWYILLL